MPTKKLRRNSPPAMVKQRFKTGLNRINPGKFPTVKGKGDKEVLPERPSHIFQQVVPGTSKEYDMPIKKKMRNRRNWQI